MEAQFLRERSILYMRYCFRNPFFPSLARSLSLSNFAMYLRIAFVAFCLSMICFAPPAGGAIFGPDNRFYPLLYVRHVNATVLPTEIEEQLEPYEVCPDNLLYVFDEVQSSGRDPATLEFLNSTTRIYGCCPNGTAGCYAAINGVIKACCPVGTLCCLDDADNFMGCVREYGQCCTGAVCPDGYGCCENAITPTEETANVTGTNTVCCPLAANSTGANDFGSYCNILNGSSLNDEYGTVSYDGCLVINLVTMPWCPVTLPANVNCSGDPLEFDCSQNQTVRCPSISECVYSPYPELANISLTNGSSILYNVSLPMGCCPVGSTPCFNAELSQLFGCADPSQNETCCGDQICPAHSKCCMQNTTLLVTDVDSNIEDPLVKFVNTTAPLGCCPNELQCCQKNLMNLLDTTDLYEHFFCGKSHEGVECAVDMHREGYWFALWQAQNEGLV